MERRAAGLGPAALLCCAPCAHASNGVFFLVPFCGLCYHNVKQNGRYMQCRH